MFDVEEIVNSAFEETTETENTETTAVEETPTESTTSPEETTQESAAEETTVTEQPEAEPTTAEQKLTLQFNHETREVTLEEARALAQKGMLYDTVADNLKWLKDLAKANGYDKVDDYRKAVEEAMTTSKAKEMASEKNIPEDVAKELVEQDAKIKQFEAEKNNRDTEAETNRKLIAEIDEFRKAYPDADVGNLPREVLEMKSQNPDVPLRFLYSAYRETQLKTENAVLAKQKQNESTSTPSLASTTESSSFADDVIKEIFG